MQPELVGYPVVFVDPTGSEDAKSSWDTDLAETMDPN